MSCSSPTACTAVGYYSNSSDVELPLAEAWNGSAWSIQATPSPSGATDSVLSGVSCASATACTADGYYYDSSENALTLAEAWNGSAWSIQTTANPTNATDSVLFGVSCTSATACTASGYDLNSSDIESPLAEAWNGSAWSIQTTPSPTGALDSVLSGVSCSSANACTAVGYSANSSDVESPLAEAWNGSAWSIQATPIPAGATNSVLDGVSCGSTTCVAIGSYDDSSGVESPLAEGWDGSAWSIQATPMPAGATDSVLDGVSCDSTACTATGSYDDNSSQLSLAEAWDGTAWSIQTSPNPAGAGYSVLDGVSCSSATACTAVGSYQDNSGQLSLAEVWNGTGWSSQTTRNPKGANYSVLDGVSCSSTTNCTAVGSYYDTSSDTNVTLAEAWNGTAWRIQTTPNPTGAIHIVLDGVSCSSATVCTAAGYYFDTSLRTEVTLAEAWNGAAWSIQATPNATGAISNVLSGVSCSSATACTAAGYSMSSSNVESPLTESWDGTAWSIQTTPSPAGATASVLNGVSCSSATACTAIGSYDNSSNVEETLAEVWNGTTWGIQTTPNPSGAVASALYGVSCTSATACTAVGFDDNSSNSEVTLAEAWNGTAWSTQTTPDPAGATTSAMDAVSCSSATVCTAIGYHQDSGTDATLAEAYS